MRDARGLDGMISENKRLVEKVFEEIRRQERLAGEDELEMTRVLALLLEADVDLSDLRKKCRARRVDDRTANYAQSVPEVEQ